MKETLRIKQLKEVTVGNAMTVVRDSGMYYVLTLYGPDLALISSWNGSVSMRCEAYYTLIHWAHKSKWRNQLCSRCLTEAQ